MPSCKLWNRLVLWYSFERYFSTVYLDEMYRTWSASGHDLLKETTREHLQLACTVSCLKGQQQVQVYEWGKGQAFLKTPVAKPVNTFSKQNKLSPWTHHSTIIIGLCIYIYKKLILNCEWKWSIIWQIIQLDSAPVWSCCPDLCRRMSHLLWHLQHRC